VTPILERIASREASAQTDEVCRLGEVKDPPKREEVREQVIVQGRRGSRCASSGEACREGSLRFVCAHDERSPVWHAVRKDQSSIQIPRGETCRDLRVNLNQPANSREQTAPGCSCRARTGWETSARFSTSVPMSRRGSSFGLLQGAGQALVLAGAPRVVLFTQDPAVLSRHPYRMATLLRNPGIVDDPRCGGPVATSR
jgi:hypothetical protein